MAIAMTVQGVEDILRAFSGLSKGVQRKYLGSAVREVVKEQVPTVKALTPKGPTGNLRRSVGFKLEKAKRSTRATGLIGYKQTRNGSNRERGFHAWWIENGVKARNPQGQALQIPLDRAKKYPYLKGKVALIGDEGGSIFFRRVQGFAGTGRFGQWADANLPAMKLRLVGKLEANLGKAIAEEERRRIRRLRSV